MRAALASLLIAGVGLAVVSGTSHPAHAAEPQGWTRSDLHPVTQPAPIGGRFVVLAVMRGRLRLVGLNARTGATVWSHPASASEVTQGVPPNVTLDLTNVIFIAPAGSTARLTAVDGRTGRVAWKSISGGLKSWPIACADPPATICVTRFAVLGGGGIARFDSATGRLLATAGVKSNSGSTRAVGDGLYDTGNRSPEALEALRGSRIAWVRPLAKIFPLRGVSTDWGWNFGRIERVGEFVGSVGSHPIRHSPTRSVFDLARTITAGFRIGDGSVVWRSRGTFVVCGVFPCPGDSQAGYSDTKVETSGGVRIVVLQRGSGRLTASLKNGKPRFALSPGTTGKLEGVDPARGRLRWTFASDLDAAVLAGYKVPPLVGPSTVALRRSGRFVAVNMLNGSAARLPPGPAWCRTAIVYRLAGSGGNTHIGQYSMTPCQAGGGRVEIPARVQPFVGRVGAASTGLVAWSDTTGVFARPIAR
jgi:outer membrane protein assembly factor BamB